MLIESRGGKLGYRVSGGLRDQALVDPPPLTATADSMFKDLEDILRSEEHTSELQLPCNFVCRLLLEKKNESNWVSSHNDLTPENSLFDGDRGWLVDWEAAFLNDRYFFFFNDTATTEIYTLSLHDVFRSPWSTKPSCASSFPSRILSASISAWGTRAIAAISKSWGWRRIPNTRTRGPAYPTFFMPFLQMSKDPKMSFMIGSHGDIELRVAGNPENLNAAVRRTLAGIDPNLTILDLMSMNEQVTRNFNQDRLIAPRPASNGLPSRNIIGSRGQIRRLRIMIEPPRPHLHQLRHGRFCGRRECC